MHIPYVGSEVMTNYDQNWENYNKKDFYYSISHFSKEEFHNKRRRMSDVVPKYVLQSAISLSIDYKMLHYFLCYVLVHRYSNRPSINDVEIQILYVIKNKIPLNWAYAIMNHMLSHTKISKGLPYGKFISKIFKYCNVNTTKEVLFQMFEKENKISIKTINNKIRVLFDKHKKTISYINEDLTQPPSRSSQHKDDDQPSEPSNQMLMDYMVQ